MRVQRRTAEVRRMYRKPQGYDTAVVLHRASRPRCAQAHSLLWETPHDQVSYVCRCRQVGSKVLRRASRRRLRSSLGHVVLPARARGRAQLTHVGTCRRPLARMGDGEWRVNIYMAVPRRRRTATATPLCIFLCTTATCGWSNFFSSWAVRRRRSDPHEARAACEADDAARPSNRAGPLTGTRRGYSFVPFGFWAGSGRAAPRCTCRGQKRFV